MKYSSSVHSYVPNSKNLYQYNYIEDLLREEGISPRPFTYVTKQSFVGDLIDWSVTTCDSNYYLFRTTIYGQIFYDDAIIWLKSAINSQLGIIRLNEVTFSIILTDEVESPTSCTAETT